MKDVHLFFDLDRTLWDFETNSENALKQLHVELELEGYGVHFPKFLKVYKQENALLWRKYGKGKVSKEHLRNHRFERTLQKFDVFDKALVESLSDGYINLSPHQTALFPNALDTLHSLSNVGYQLHIITNGFKEVQFIKLEKSGLHPYFDLILCSEEVGVNKPALKIFKHAMDVVGAKPSSSVMIGDDYEVDVVGAIQAGMHGVHFDPYEQRKLRQDDFRIRNLAELPELLPWILRNR